MEKKQSKKKKTSKATSAAEFDIPLALLRIRLLDSKCEQASIGAKPLSKFTVNASCETAEPIVEGDSWIVSYRVGSEILCSADPQDGEVGSHLSAVCRYELQFIMSRQPSMAELKKAANIAMHCGWPYVRSFISTILKEMGQVSIILPLLAIDEKHGPKFFTPASNATLQSVSE